MPGDSLEYRQGLLYINGQRMSDSYSRQTADFTLQEVCGLTKIPADYYFVLGDNRQNSLDSRGFGLVSKGAVFGIVGE